MMKILIGPDGSHSRQEKPQQPRGISSTRARTPPTTLSPFEILRRWLVQCPQCSEVCLVVGARENDQYVCKDCGHSFTITNDDLAEQSREDQERLEGRYRW